MIIARTVKRERREARLEFAIKFLDDSRRRRETQSRPPNARIERGQLQRLILPGVVEIEMKRAAQKIISAGAIRSGCRFVLRAEDFLPLRSASDPSAALLRIAKS